MSEIYNWEKAEDSLEMSHAQPTDDTVLEASLSTQEFKQSFGGACVLIGLGTLAIDVFGDGQAAQIAFGHELGDVGSQAVFAIIYLQLTNTGINLMRNRSLLSFSLGKKL